MLRPVLSHLQNREERRNHLLLHQRMDPAPGLCMAVIYLCDSLGCMCLRLLSLWEKGSVFAFCGLPCTIANLKSAAARTRTSILKWIEVYAHHRLGFVAVLGCRRGRPWEQHSLLSGQDQRSLVPSCPLCRGRRIPLAVSRTWLLITVSRQI